MAIALAAVAVLTLGATSRILITGDRSGGLVESRAAEAVIETTGTFQVTSDHWVDQLTNPSAWRGGQFRERRRPMSREEERREREQEAREARERRDREEREAREERLREEREAREETWGRARELGRERGTYRTVCVRLCDGYFFPISFATTPDRFAADEAACNARCSSGARLYVYPNPGGEPEDMRDVRGQPYTALKNAFLFRTSYVEACTCKPHPWEREALARHRLYAEQAQKSRRQVAAKVVPTARASGPKRDTAEKRENLGPRPIDLTATNPAAPSDTSSETTPVVADQPAPVSDVAANPPRPDGAMLLGAQEPTPSTKRASRTRTAERPPRERRRTNSARSSSGKPEWASRVFGGNY